MLLVRHYKVMKWREEITENTTVSLLSVWCFMEFVTVLPLIWSFRFTCFFLKMDCYFLSIIWRIYVGWCRNLHFSHFLRIKVLMNYKILRKMFIWHWLFNVNNITGEAICLSRVTLQREKKLLQTDGWLLCCIKSRTRDCDVN